MIHKITDWIKNNKITALLIVVVLVLLWPQLGYGNFPLFSTTGQYVYNSKSGVGSPGSPTGYAGDSYESGFSAESYMPIPDNNYPPTTGGERMVIQDVSLSMLVKNVVEVKEQILNKTTQLGGYMVNSNVSGGTDSPYATIVVRVPTKDMTTTVEAFKALAVDVKSENLSGRDVTDEFADLEKQYAVLRGSQIKFEQLLEKAEEIQDILTITEKVLYVQNQIDSVKGRQQYLSQTAEFTKITIYLSSDELALPYAPDNVFRPGVIFKLAVRALFTTLYGIAEKLIWVAVFSVIWFPAGLVALLIYKRFRHKNG